jgi:hypothetical protein
MLLAAAASVVVAAVSAFLPPALVWVAAPSRTGWPTQTSVVAAAITSYEYTRSMKGKRMETQRKARKVHLLVLVHAVAAAEAEAESADKSIKHKQNNHAERDPLRKTSNL